MEDKTRTKRVFINDVDQYTSKNIAEFLATCTPETSEEPGDDTVFQVVGTVSSSREEKSKFLHKTYKSPSRQELFEYLLESDVVVYNVSETATKIQFEEALWAFSALRDEMESFRNVKIFILVSTVMTWTMTKTEVSDDTDAVLKEENFKRRRPHPNFRHHLNLEKLVLKVAKTKKTRLNGYVIGSGFQYGRGEHFFHYFFKVSWLMQFPKVPVFGNGTNYIPMIHVLDIGGLIQNVVIYKPKLKYMLAIDSSTNTLGEIVQKISSVLGPGQIETLPVQDAIAMEAFKTNELDYLKIDLRLESFVIKESFRLKWICQAGMVGNMKSIVEEYKNTRQLKAIKMCLIGPPAVGKTTIAEKLCCNYKIHHIKVKDPNEGQVKELEEEANETDAELVSGGEKAAAAAEKQPSTAEESIVESEGQNIDLISHTLLEKLKSRQCMNQGFVLDGFFETYEDAKNFFSVETKESQDAESKTNVYNTKILPDYVFELKATDNFLIKRVQELPESVAEQMHYTQEEFVSRLKTYREHMSAEETSLNFFDELEIHPQEIEVGMDDPEYTEPVNKIREIVGPPKNYGLSPKEQEEEDRRKEQMERKKLAAELFERKLKSEAALAEMTAQYEEWKKNLSEVTRQEDQLLEARALPLRNYLMKHVMPSLAVALSDCGKIKPEEPVDYLAEHLLRNTKEEDNKHL